MWVTTIANSKQIKINTDCIVIFYPEILTVVLSSGKELVFSSADYDEVESAVFPTRKRVAKVNTDLADYLNTLHRMTGGKSTAILTPQRQKKLTDLLKTMSPEQLMTAAENIGNDKWLQGKDPTNTKRYGDIDYLLRPDKAAKWAEYKPDDKRKKLF